MKILITGGCGFLGSNLAAGAIERGYELTIFDNLSRVGGDRNLSWLRGLGEFTFIHGDTRDAQDIERAVAKTQPDMVFHLAGQVAMTTSLDNPRLDFQTNAFGTFNLLDAVRRHCPGSGVVYSSTNKVYGDLEWLTYNEGETRYHIDGHPNGLDEKTPLDFHSPYGCSKGAADQYMLDFARAYGLKTVVLRHSSMYGARQFGTFDQGWISWFAQQALRTKAGTLDKPFTIAGNGKQVRDVLEASDMIELYFKTAENLDQAAGHAFNIGGGMENSLSLLELFALLEKVVDTKLVYTHLPARYSDQRVFVADITKAERILNWKPAKSASDGIAEMVHWLQSAS